MSDAEDIVLGKRYTYSSMEGKHSRNVREKDDGEYSGDEDSDNEDSDDEDGDDGHSDDGHREIEESYSQILENMKARLSTILPRVQEVSGQETQPSTLQVLDISYIDPYETVNILKSVLLSEQTRPLRTIVLNKTSDILQNPHFPRLCHDMGWRVTQPGWPHEANITLHRVGSPDPGLL